MITIKLTEKEKENLGIFLQELYWHENEQAYKYGDEYNKERLGAIAILLAKVTKDGAK